jgi:hypothetical protein
MRSRGVLFAVLTAGLVGIALAAASGGEPIIAAAAVVLALWMADLARRDLLPRRRG